MSTSTGMSTAQVIMPQSGMKRNAERNNRHGPGAVPDLTELAAPMSPFGCDVIPRSILRERRGRVERRLVAHRIRRLGESWTAAEIPRCLAAHHRGSAPDSNRREYPLQAGGIVVAADAAGAAGAVPGQRGSPVKVP